MTSDRDNAQARNKHYENELRKLKSHYFTLKNNYDYTRSENERFAMQNDSLTSEMAALKNLMAHSDAKRSEFSDRLNKALSDLDITNNHLIQITQRMMLSEMLTTVV